jgi:hypothetical protein
MNILSRITVLVSAGEANNAARSFVEMISLFSFGALRDGNLDTLSVVGCKEISSFEINQRYAFIAYC